MPANIQNNRSRTRVEPEQASKEFLLTDDTLTVEVVCAAKLLDDYFTNLGYPEWILGGVCSRKLLEKVQQRVPNPVLAPMSPDAPNNPDDAGQAPF